MTQRGETRDRMGAKLKKKRSLLVARCRFVSQGQTFVRVVALRCSLVVFGRKKER